MPLDYWKDRFQTANPSQYHQFKNKTPEKKDQMATAALYKARQPNNENFVAETAMMGKIADSGKIIRILKKAHTVPFSDEKNWLLVDTDPGKGNSGLGIKWIPADTRFEWVRPYKDTVDENLSPQTIHKLADRKGVKWDNEPSFLQLTKRLTGKEHLDDLDQAGLNKVKRHLDGLQEMAENTATGINRMFNNLGDPVYSNLQRVALLAMQGRQSEAAGRLQSVIKDASTDIQKKITDAVNNIKPVTINGKIADSSTLDKSKQHNDWIINTFIPWVQSLLGKQGVAEGLK